MDTGHRIRSYSKRIFGQLDPRFDQNLWSKVSNVNKEGVKRVISFAVFGLGMLGGLWSCSRYAHAMFVANDNDSPPGLLAITLAFATPLPACVVALWKRLAAGVWLIVSGCYLPIGIENMRSGHEN